MSNLQNTYKKKETRKPKKKVIPYTFRIIKNSQEEARKKNEKLLFSTQLLLVAEAKQKTIF